MAPEDVATSLSFQEEAANSRHEGPVAVAEEGRQSLQPMREEDAATRMAALMETATMAQMVAWAEAPVQVA
jgi:hypothetical protein